MPANNEIDAVDLFGGPGGWDLAAQALGIDSTGIEWDDSACATRKAAALPTVQADVRDLNPLHYRTKLQIGSPPCQGFSMAGSGKGREDSILLLERLESVRTLDDLEAAIEDLRHLMTDEKTLLVLEPLRWALTTKPDMIAWEQVPAVQPIWDACGRILGFNGYTTDTRILTAEMFGVPQTRRRSILVARSAAMSFALGPARLPIPTHSKYYNRTPSKLDAHALKWVSMAEALGWTPTDLVGFPRKYDGQGEAIVLDDVEYRARDLREATEPALTVTEKARSTLRFTGQPVHADAPVELEAMGDVRMKHGCVRPLDAPAPTLTASMDNGNYQFVRAVSNNSDDPQPFRPVTVPSPTIMGSGRHPGFRWVDLEERVNNQSGSAYDISDQVSQPASAMAGRGLVTFRGANANRFNGSTKSRNDGIRVSVQEAACLQTFPADHPWQGSKTQQFQQVGNAIPPLLAYVVLASVLGREIGVPWGGGPLNESAISLRNNNSANAAVRRLDQPAPTLYFGARLNYCAWEPTAQKESA